MNPDTKQFLVVLANAILEACGESQTTPEEMPDDGNAMRGNVSQFPAFSIQQQQPAPVQQQPAPVQQQSAPVAVAAVTVQDISAAFQNHCATVGQQKGTDDVISILRQFGVSRVSEADPAVLPQMLQALQQIQ